MAQILPSEEAIEYEDRTYVNPQTIVDQTSDFITNLRNTQQANTQEIANQTSALGTEVPSNLGGLGGATSYWTSRYQTPQTNSAIAELRSAAQATALTEALQNEKDAMQKRYNDAYRAYQQRSWNKTYNYNTGSGGGGGGDGEGDDPDYTSSGDALTVGENDVVLPEDTNSGFTQSYAQTNALTGGGVPAGTAGTAYTLVDKNGNKTGIRIYSSNQTVSGVETPYMSYTGDVNRGLFGGIQYGGGTKMIQDTIASGGRLLDSGGTDITTGWYWRVTH